MKTSEIILRLVALILLGSYLLAKHRQRVRNWPVKDFPDLPARPLEAALQARVQQIREDYSAELHSPRHAGNRRANLIARAGRTLRCLDYFRDREAEHEHQSRPS